MNLDDEQFLWATKRLAQTLPEKLPLDYSEESLEIVDGVMALTLEIVPPDTAEEMLKDKQAVVGLFREYNPVQRIQLCVTYTGEVVCRNLGGTWTIRKPLLRPRMLGVEIVSSKEFFPLVNVESKMPSRSIGLPSKTYLAIKARVVGVSIEQVQLSSESRLSEEEVRSGYLYLRKKTERESERATLVGGDEAAGNAAEMAERGCSYLRGADVPRDLAEGRRWLEKAAAAGSAEAMYVLGSLSMGHFGEEDVARGIAEARRWWEKAAVAGVAQAMLGLGSLYLTGEGVPKNVAEARRWFEKAAAAGDADAMLNVGALYLTGEGVPKNVAEARRWFEKAAAAGSKEASRILQDLVRSLGL